MKASLPERAVDSHRKPLAMRGESLSKSFADPDDMRAAGRLIERALEILGSTKQQAAGAMGYEDPSALSRWIQGTENPRLAVLLKLSGFRAAFIIALAEGRDSGVEVRTLITVARIA